MKKIINNKVYDTETAQELASWANTWNTRDFNRVEETLYRKKTGEYFIHGEGGPLTQYARTIGTNEWSSGERIMPLSVKEAQTWAEKHLDGNEYESIFGVPDESTVILTAYIQANLYARLRDQATEKGMSLSAYVAELLAESQK